MKMFRKRFLAGMALVILLLGAAAPTWAAQSVVAANNGPVRNVIFMMSDGTSVAGTTLTRWYNGGQPLAVDEIVTGAMRSFSAESLITDSAPAATAFATGHFTDTKLIGVLPATVTTPGVAPVAAGDAYRPVANVMEGARALGKATGLVATANIQHASPAAFSTHWPDRNNYNELAEQQVYAGFDVVLGGGLKYLKPKEQGGTRTDGDDLTGVLSQRGYTLVTTPAAMREARGPKLWGAFAADAMAYDLDRDPTREPSLAEMTRKAIEVLNQNKKGFCLFVEASKVDWAAHANDPIGVISDINAFNQAVKVALDFARADGKTLLIVASDHGTGGISIGNAESNKDYDTTGYDSVLGPLLKAKRTGEGLEPFFLPDFSNVNEVMAQYYGITDLTDAEITAIKEAKPGKLNAVVGPMLSKRAKIGWTTTGHTGEDLFLYGYGPGKPTGMVLITDLAGNMAANLGFDLADVSHALYVPADEAFGAAGYAVTLDAGDAANPVLVVTKGGTRAEFVASTDIVRLNGQEHQLDGLIVAAQGKVYLPQEGVDLVLKGAKR